MTVGMALWPNQDLLALAELATVTEDAGFDELWWPDHYDARECSAVLTMCVAHTTSIRLGTAVTSPLLRHPAILSSLFSTLSEASNGRMMAGLGPGGFDVKTDLHLAPDSPLTVTREAVSIMRTLMAGQTAQVGGRYFSVEAAELAFEAPPVPLYLAGRGARMIELAGEVADGVITHGLASPYLEMAFDRVARGAARSGQGGTECDLVLMYEVAIDSDPARGRDSLRPRCVPMVGGEYPEELIPLYGLDPGSVQRVRQAVRAHDPRAPELIDDEMVDAFAVAGPPERIADSVVRLSEMGIRSVILSPGRRVGADTIRELGKALAGVLA